MNDNRKPSAQELVPDFISQLYPEMIPLNVIVIVEALSVEHQRGLYAFANDDATPWTVEGMLSLVRNDNMFAWTNHSNENDPAMDWLENEEE